ncbi:hypothetical protein O181_030351 [Austropuccinia psidii MF-1]|uniref:Uncharacterized protein n=1 Tax=Austropuccinia psidii MF-1 TaxID=1389203 RepID=A0A9Q3CSU8_9BASI|nr:hypothetical protein [Austropuccinia psidii MF-1]
MRMMENNETTRFKEPQKNISHTVVASGCRPRGTFNALGNFLQNAMASTVVPEADERGLIHKGIRGGGSFSSSHKALIFYTLWIEIF